MKKSSLFNVTAAALMSVALGTVPVSALPTFSLGSFAYNATTDTTTDVTTTTSFNLPTPQMDLPGTRTGDFLLVTLPTNLAITSPIDFTNAGVNSFDWNDANIGSFDATSVVLLGSGCVLSLCTAAYGVIGTFTLGSAWANVGAILSASETWSLTQTGGPGSSISISGTFNAPSSLSEVPEPSTYLLLITGALGLLGYRWRRQS